MVARDYPILFNGKIGESIYKICIAAPEIAAEATPGQFVNVRLRDEAEPMLRRPISICQIEGSVIHLVYQVVGKGTELLSTYGPSQMVNLMGPVGNGFPIGIGRKAAVIGGGIGTAPLLELSKRLDCCDAYLGYRSEPFLVEEFEKNCCQVIVATEDGSVGEKGYVIDFVRNLQSYDVVYACGPKIFLQKVKELCEENGILCYLSLEERMGCGLGACLVCNCKIKSVDGWNYKRVCKDGPVFDSKEVILYD